jgi:hypothetical protein
MPEWLSHFYTLKSGTFTQTRGFQPSPGLSGCHVKFGCQLASS